VQTIIQDIDTTKTFIFEFLNRSKRHWHVRRQLGLGVTSIDPMCTEKSEGDEVKEHHVVEAQIMQKDTREENVITLEEQLFIEVQLNVQQATKE
jgi:hypothetical protein